MKLPSQRKAQCLRLSSIRRATPINPTGIQNEGREGSAFHSKQSILFAVVSLSVLLYSRERRDIRLLLDFFRLPSLNECSVDNQVMTERATARFLSVFSLINETVRPVL